MIHTKLRKFVAFKGVVEVQLILWLIAWLIGWLIVLLIVCLIMWFMVWFIVWFINTWIRFSNISKLLAHMEF